MGGTGGDGGYHPHSRYAFDAHWQPLLALPFGHNFRMLPASGGRVKFSNFRLRADGKADFRRCYPQATSSFHPRESDSDLLRVFVRNVVLPVIGLHSLAMEKAPLRSGIASFTRRYESYGDGHHVFILGCHGRAGPPAGDQGK